MKKSIGVDVGGTKIEAVLIDSKLKVIRSAKVKTPKANKELIEAITIAIREAKGTEKINSIGLGIAGFVQGNTVISSPNIPCIKNFRPAGKLKKKFRCSVVLENDANMFAFGEWLARKKPSSLAAVTAGTGIGCGVIDSGKLVKGKGIASELGHSIIGCENGKPESFENLAAGKALVKRAEKNGLKTKSAKEVAESKSNAAREAIRETGHWLGIGLANCANSFDPEIIVLGGGLSEIPLIESEAKKEMNKHLVVKNRCKLVLPKLKHNSAAFGAAAYSLRLK